MEINIIAAISDNYAIGRKNALLWHISEDMKYFRKVTGGGTVVMGRKTFQSIGKALPGRKNIVITRGREMEYPENVTVAHSLEEAFGIASNENRKCFVIGGGEIYRQALDFASRIYLTKVHTEIEDADTFFPELPSDTWEKTWSSGPITDTESGLSFEFLILERRQAN